MTKIDNSQTIRTQFEALKKQSSEYLRTRNAARQLKISEGELLAAHVGVHVIRLQDGPQKILESIVSLGEVMAITRNDGCVHERKGIYENSSFNKHGNMSIGLFVNPDIDLRLFMSHWIFCFAVNENDRKSIQFFDKSGEALHKIYLTNNSDKQAYEKLIEKFQHESQDPFIIVDSYEPKTVDRSDSEIDWIGFRETWENLKDTHDFDPMLRKFKVGRQQALQNIGRDFAYLVHNDAPRKILQLARDKQCEIMVFVGNRGCIQIHTGPVQKLLEQGTWYNVLDPKFNLHLDEDHIAKTWVTRKPTVDGIVTALEVFDQHGEIITTFFGKRKPGIPELDLWREIIKTLPAKEVSNVA